VQDQVARLATLSQGARQITGPLTEGPGPTSRPGSHSGTPGGTFFIDFVIIIGIIFIDSVVFVDSVSGGQ
jgi:hypothetical protein